MITSTLGFLIFYGFIGLAVGSFLNVVIIRVPKGESISLPASHCVTCKHPLKWYHNIPLFSWIFLGGKCAFCKEKISHVKCPRSVDFEEELPRHPTGKLYKRLLKDRYWK